LSHYPRLGDVMHDNDSQLRWKDLSRATKTEVLLSIGGTIRKEFWKWSLIQSTVTIPIATAVLFVFLRWLPFPGKPSPIADDMFFDPETGEMRTRFVVALVPAIFACLIATAFILYTLFRRELRGQLDGKEAD